MLFDILAFFDICYLAVWREQLEFRKGFGSVEYGPVRLLGFLLGSVDSYSY